MRFLFVDQITGRSEAAITGKRRFPSDEPLQYQGKGGAEVAPGAVCEAIGQLASWFCLERNQFYARPVFLFAERIDVVEPVPVGSELDLNVTIHSQDAEAFNFSGEARLDGMVVQRVVDCGGYFMPLGDLEDPGVTRERFAALTGGGLTLAGATAKPYPFRDLAGKTLALKPGQEIRTHREFLPTEPFYADHFPRFPVTPIVMLNEMIGQATLRLLGLDSPAKLRPLAIHRIKIRNFVAPGDSCEALVQAKGERTHKGQRFFDATGELFKDGKRILRGEYQYELLG